MPNSARQKRIAGRVLHEFAHGELKSSHGEPVTSRRQAVAIALSEAGASRKETPKQKHKALARTKAKEAKGETAQQEREGRARIGAGDKRESTPAMGGLDARQPTVRGAKAAASRARKPDGHSRASFTRERRAPALRDARA